MSFLLSGSVYGPKKISLIENPAEPDMSFCILFFANGRIARKECIC